MPIEIAIETDKGLFVAALTAAGFTLFPINPRAAARYRERHGQAGGKSDRGDAVMLANILRTDRHVHRPLPADTELARAIKTTARQHQEAIWARQQAMNRLRSLLRDYYPQALVAFPNLAHRAAASVLRAAPTPQAAARITPRRVVTLLKQAGRRNDAGLAEKISSTLRAEALRQPTPVEHALGVAALGLIEVITVMSEAITALKAELATMFDQHAQAQSSPAFPDSVQSSAPECSASLAMTRTVSPTPPPYAVSPAPPRSPAPPGEAGWSPHGGSATGAWAMLATGGPMPH
jgi:hypothetical protein